ncbi:protein-glutamate methylesterase/protein-glutamine glutaminase [Coralloluteibacterium thermophilus]|uniref:Protein-glutamate methylesterase/protein-glutamine glutaminase n=1 Tax=Coralloluteibacterium thermophilum TaxID=2707049 RepID=A0ABV9NG85_9GAMM
MPIKVLVVDDSALIRQLLTEILSADDGIEVVGTASDPYIARSKIKALRPDVLTLDVEMPRMDGLKFLENLMRLHPLPVVMVSSLTERGADVTLAALALGAVDFVTKPRLEIARGMHDYAELVREKIRGAARARPAPPLPREVAPVLPQGYRTTDRLIALGASAGGTEALRVVMEAMPADAPAVVMTQHIPAGFSRPFAERLNRSSAMTVCEAEDGQPITPGCGYVAPGGRHLEVVRSGARWLCRLTDAEPVCRHRPSVDVLFGSVLRAAGRNAVAGLLTGMGDDGARGLLALRRAGVRTLVQDEASCVVWGMPGAAHRLGAADEVVPLGRVAERLLAFAAE